MCTNLLEITLTISYSIHYFQKKDGDSVSKPKAKTLGGLPPPPGGMRLAPPGGAKLTDGMKPQHLLVFTLAFDNKLSFVQVLTVVLNNNQNHNNSKNGVISRVPDLALTQLLQSNHWKIKIAT